MPHQEAAAGKKCEGILCRGLVILLCALNAAQILLLVYLYSRLTPQPTRERTEFEAVRARDDGRIGPRTIAFEEVLVDTESSFDLKAGSFVAPVNGVYRFAFFGMANGTNISIAIERTFLPTVTNHSGDKSTEVLQRVSLPPHSGKYTYRTWSYAHPGHFVSQEVAYEYRPRPIYGEVTVRLKKRDGVRLRQETSDGFYYAEDGSVKLTFHGSLVGEEKAVRRIMCFDFP